MKKPLPARHTTAHPDPTGRRGDTPTCARDRFERLQRLAGNRAVASLVTRAAPSTGRHGGGREPFVQRDPIPGGVGGALSTATGGAVGLTEIHGSFTIPGGLLLSGTAARHVRTTEPTTVTARVSSTDVTLHFSPAIFVDAQWPAQNMRIYRITHTLSDNVTATDVRLVDDEWGDGFVDMTGTARENVSATVGQIIRQTLLHRARTRTPGGHEAPTMQAPPPRPPLAPTYDPLADPDPQGTIRALAANVASLPSEGERDEVAAAQVTDLSVGATIVVNRAVQQVDDGAGIRIAAGTAVTVQVESGASVPQLQQAGGGAAALAGAADIRTIHVSSSGIEVIKDGAAVARIEAMTVHRGGRVSIEHLTLLGEAAEAAAAERGLWWALGAVLGAAQARQDPFYARAGRTISDAPVIVPGLVRGTLEQKLQEALTGVLADQGRSVVPGVDLGSVLGVPGAPVPGR